jgi:hypothetical protein
VSDEETITYIEELVMECRDAMRNAGVALPHLMMAFKVKHGETFKQAIEQLAAERRLHVN